MGKKPAVVGIGVVGAAVDGSIVVLGIGVVEAGIDGFVVVATLAGMSMQSWYSFENLYEGLSKSLKKASYSFWMKKVWVQAGKKQGAMRRNERRGWRSDEEEGAIRRKEQQRGNSLSRCYDNLWSLINWRLTLPLVIFPKVKHNLSVKDRLPLVGIWYKVPETQIRWATWKWN